MIDEDVFSDGQFGEEQQLLIDDRDSGLDRLAGIGEAIEFAIDTNFA